MSIFIFVGVVVLAARNVFGDLPDVFFILCSLLASFQFPRCQVEYPFS